MDRKRILTAAMSGLMLSASFPPGRTAWLAWLALVPLFRAFQGQGPSTCLRLGLTAGLSHFLSLIYWVTVVLHTYGGLNPILSAAALTALAAYLSLYIGIFGWAVYWIRDSRFAVLLIAAIWTVLEYVRANALTGFPWCLVGHSQFQYPWLIQAADLSGVYGLSFLIVAVNASIFSLVFCRGKKRPPWPYLQAVGPAVLLVSALAYGQTRLLDERDEVGKGAALRTALIQGNIDQSQKWDPAFQEQTVKTYIRLTRAASRAEPDLVIWPETALPLFFQDPSLLASEVRSATAPAGAHLLFGSPAYSRSDGALRYYNRAYLLSRDGEVRDYYDKVHLVPFGEYVPFKRFLPFIDRLVASAGDFEPGKDVGPLQGAPYPAGVLICFEAIFPELARTQAREGARLLVNITNDAWFGKTSAPFQHLAMSVFRSVETRLPMVRVANTGISAFVDSKGRIVEKGPLFEKSILTREIFPGAGSPSVYTLYGDFLVFFLFIMIILKIVSLWRHRPFRLGG
ncbi:MAG: apolipoprotein N-acyltransferase [Desulfobacteraceae bacterium]